MSAATAFGARALRRGMLAAVLAACCATAVVAADAPAPKDEQPAARPRRPLPEPLPPPIVPPQRAAKPLATVPLVNAGFEQPAPRDPTLPDGWSVGQHAGPHSYDFEPDTKIVRGGKRSLRVTNVGPEPYGAIYQGLAADAYRGKSLRLSAWLRTDGVTGNRFATGAGLRLYSLRGGHATHVAEMLRDTARGTTGWTRYEVTLKVPADAEWITVGMALYGPGTVWIDDVALDVVAASD